jgi:FAD-linked oxidoreductase
LDVTDPWRNWARDQHCAPLAIEHPAGESELAGLVAGAAERGTPIRAVGSGHSFTDIACTDGLMIDLSRMPRLIAADPATGRVTVEAGIKIRALGSLLAEHGLALENQGDVDGQTLAGALATATHGTGLSFGNLSSQVVGMRLVLASGEVVDLTQESDPEGLLAARVGLGALGIASTVTLQCVPLYRLYRNDRPAALGDVLDRLDDAFAVNDHYEFFVFPYTRTALTRTSTRTLDTTPAPTRPSAGWAAKLQEAVLENAVLELICRTGRLLPRLTPVLNRLISSSLSATELNDHAHRVYASRRMVRFTEMEYAIPRAHAREAVERVLELIERRRLPILFPLEVRIAAGDDAFLSTAHGRETCYIAVHQYAGMAFESYFRSVEAIMDDYDGRPHWGKRHYQRAETLSGRYPDWDRFQAVRARWDPTGVFTNDYTRRTLGPAGVVAAVS